jgi:hypothetical protein
LLRSNGLVRKTKFLARDRGLLRRDKSFAKRRDRGLARKKKIKVLSRDRNLTTKKRSINKQGVGYQLTSRAKI